MRLRCKTGGSGGFREMAGGAALAALMLSLCCRATCEVPGEGAGGLLGGLPPGSVLLEAESFEREGQWYVAPTRVEVAPWGLSGGNVLGSNVRDAVASKTADLPEGNWTVWARVFDWGGAPGHYELTLDINGQSRQIAVTEPIASTYVWERWGTVVGGPLAIEVSNPDSFNSGLDCVLFVPDPEFVPSSGPKVELVESRIEGTLPGEPASIWLRLRVVEAVAKPGNVFVAVLRATAERPGRRSVVWSEEMPLPDDDRGSWPEGREVEVPEVRVPPLPHLWPDEYTVNVGVQNTSLAVGEKLATFREDDTAMPQPVRAEVRPHRGSPALFIDGEPDFPFAYLNHAGDRERYYAQMAEIGVRFFTAGGGIGATPDGFDPAGCDRPFLQVLRQQRDALIFPRVGVTAPQWWLEKHPEERVQFDDGTVGPQSMFSETWLEDACGWIEDYSRYIRRSPYANHVMGIHICSGVSAEWQSWGLWSDQRGDFSAPAVRAWRDYLRTKYGSDGALSEAWERDVNIAEAPIPTRARRQADTGFFRMPGEHQDIIDFYDFYWRGTARAIEALAAAAKRGGGRDWLVGFFYGYAIQHGGKMQESQHLGLREILDCPDIDFLCSPAMYSQRQPGGTSTFMSHTESIKLRRKLWFHEADNRTHLAADRLAAAEDLSETLNVLKREFAHVVTRQAGVWWFDMQGGWYDDPQVLDLLRQMREFGESNRSRWLPRAEIAIFIDDKSSHRLAPESPFLHDGITQLMAELPRLGAPYDTYLLSDVSEAERYRMVVFPLAFDLTDGERASIDRLKRGGRTLVFVGKAGIGRYEGGRAQHSPALSESLLGFVPAGDDWRHVSEASWRIHWTPKPHPSLGELRRIAKQAGVHLYHEEDDALYAGNGMIALHAQSASAKTLRLGRRLRVRELFEEAPLQAEADEITFEMAAKETRCFAVDPR